jgi:quercetin dioxygenase-like cupin family protein
VGFVAVALHVMTSIFRSIAVLVVCLAPIGAAGRQAKSPAPATGHTVVRPDAVGWKPLRPGAEIAVVSGDPDKPGAPFVMRMRYRGAARIPPHWHPTDEHITVLSGTIVVGMGERFDESSGTELHAGAYAFVPTKMAHYAWTKGDAVVQVHGLGPFTINYVNPADDPKNAAPSKR